MVHFRTMTMLFNQGNQGIHDGLSLNKYKRLTSFHVQVKRINNIVNICDNVIWYCSTLTMMQSICRGFRLFSSSRSVLETCRDSIIALFSSQNISDSAAICCCYVMFVLFLTIRLPVGFDRLESNAQYVFSSRANNIENFSAENILFITLKEII